MFQWMHEAGLGDKGVWGGFMTLLRPGGDNEIDYVAEDLGKMLQFTERRKEALKQKLKKRKLTCARWSQETFDDSMSKLSVIGAA